MAEITEPIDVAVPATTAYNQWTQVEGSRRKGVATVPRPQISASAELSSIW